MARCVLPVFVGPSTAVTDVPTIFRGQDSAARQRCTLDVCSSRDRTDGDAGPTLAMILNPFPGPQPFREVDRAYFNGRADLSRRLEGAILVHRAVVVHGPSGSGKSSLIQASVLPNLRDAEDVRVVHLDGWPPGEVPLRWLSLAMHSALKHGTPPEGMTPHEAVLSSLKRAARGSSRLLVVCIDQLEQLLYPDRDPKQAEEFFDCVNEMLELPLRTLRVVMSLREDYLGLFRDRLRNHKRLLAQGFRVGPLTVAELTEAMCQTAASGKPPQEWSPKETRSLIMQARVPGQAETDEAEVQAAYGQIVCRSLFQDRSTGEHINEPKGVRIEAILQKYLETTLADLGPLRGEADRLLADHLVSGEGGRTLRTERELENHFAKNDLRKILERLERSAILHAASHQGSRYFEIGHDWLARKVFENRQLRERQEEQRRKDEEQARVLEKARQEREKFRYLALGAFVLVAIAVVGLVAILLAKRDAERAEKAAQRAALVAKRREIEARDASILAGVRELSSRGKLTWAMKLLPEIQLPALRRGWVALASDLLAGNTLRSTLEGHTASVSTASYSPDGKWILTASVDGTARIWDAEGKTKPIVLSGHTDAIRMASWSHDGKSILALSEDGTVRIFSASGEGDPLLISSATGRLLYAELSPDDKRVVTSSIDGFVRIHELTADAPVAEIQASKMPIHCVRFHPDGVRVFFGLQDARLMAWDGESRSKPVEIGKHDAPVQLVAMSPKGTHVVSTSSDGAAYLWSIANKKPKYVSFIQHDGPVTDVTFSADGSMVATGAFDRLARVLRVEGTEPPVVLTGHTQAITHVAFDPTGYFLATASQDATARVFRIKGGVSLVLRGHGAALHSVAWRNDGASVVTAAGDGTDRSPDETAKIWDVLGAQRLGFGSSGPHTFHAADGALAAQRLVTVHDDGSAHIITRDNIEVPIVLPGAEAWVAGVSLSSEGKLLATASFDKQVRLIHVDKPANITILGAHDAEARFVVFSPDGKHLLSGGDDNKAFVFAVDGSSGPVKLEGHLDWLTAGAWSRDGKRVVTASFDRTARVWNANGQGAPTALIGHDAEILAVAFFHDNQRIATASADHTARIWIAGGEVQTLRHDAPVQKIAVSADNKFVATYAADHLIRVWRVGTYEPPIELESASAISLLGFDPEKHVIVAFDEEGALHAWTVDVDSLRERILVANGDCVPPPIRALYLNEKQDAADMRYADCKRNPQLMPWFEVVSQDVLNAGQADPKDTMKRLVETKQAMQATQLSPGNVRVKLVVVPTDADVEVDSMPMVRRFGVVEFVGKPGQTRKVHVQRGAKHRTFEVVIHADGYSPTRLDLNEKLPVTPRSGVADNPPTTKSRVLIPRKMQ